MVNRLKNIWWGPAIAIYAGARLFSLLAFLFFAQIQEANYWTAARPNYFDFLNIWDVEWYHKIYDHGYPAALPLGLDGSVQNNEWAFYPGFPYLIRAINWLTGVEWKYLAPLVATIFGFAFILVAYKLLRLWLDQRVTLWAIALISISWVSPILQVGYAESMYLFFITLALYAYAKRRDWLVILSIAIAALVRPGTLAFGLMFVVLAVLNRKDARERWRLLGLAAISGLLGLAWLVIAWVATGQWDAYLQTENSWRAGFTGHEQIMPFLGWFESGRFFIGDGIGQVFIAAMVALIVWIFVRPSTRMLGQELYVWSASYLVYLFMFFFPQASSPRILLPAFPLLAALAMAITKGPRWVRVLCVALSLVGQVFWLWVCWKYTAPDYTPP